MKIIKKLLYILLFTVLNFNFTFALRNTYIKDNLTNNNWENVITWVESWNLNTLDYIINYFQDTVSSLIFLLAVWVFIYIWIKLVFARWNPEDFKKNMLHFTYAAIWFFVIAASWALVKLVAWLNI